MAEQQQQTTVPKVFAAIHSVLSEFAKLGVGKNATNTQQNFKYRAIEDVMDTLAPLLAKHFLIILPSFADHKLTERQTRSGSSALHATLQGNYKFVCPLDGSSEVVGPIPGEAIDLGDKSTNKAMSAAYKYLCTQSFCIPFSADDPDAQSHEIAGTGAVATSRSGPPGSDAPAASTAPVPGMEPDVPRPGGMFAYGKKFRETPWNVMKGRDLEFFLKDADYTPEDVRQKIVAEMAWRDYEAAQLERVDEEIRKDRERPLDEEIP